MKVCRNCGYQNPDGHQFCQGCGQKLEAWGSAAVPPENMPRKKRTAVWIAVIVTVLAVVAVVLFLVLGTDLLSGWGGDREEASSLTEEEAVSQGEGASREEEEGSSHAAVETALTEEGEAETAPSEEAEEDSAGDAPVASIDYASPIPVPCSVTASSTLSSSFSADNLQDKDLTTAWAEGAAGNGVGESLTYRPQDAGNTLIYGIAVAPGLQTNLEIYKAYSYPVLLRINGEGIDVTVNLNFYLADF